MRRWLIALAVLALAATPLIGVIYAADANAPMGKVHVAHNNWTASLAGKDGTLSISGAAAPVDVPAGDYLLAGYREISDPKTFIQFDQPAKGKAPDVKVAQGQTVELNLGSPLVGKLRPSVNGKAVTFTFELADSGGRPISNVMVNGAKPSPPQYEIMDSSGKKVHTGSMAYG